MPFVNTFTADGTGIHQVGTGVVTGAEILAAAAAVAQSADTAKKIDDAYGMSRMWQTRVEDTGWQTAVFRQRDQAVTWLRDRIPESPSDDYLCLMKLPS